MASARVELVRSEVRGGALGVLHVVDCHDVHVFEHAERQVRLAGEQRFGVVV